MPDRAEKKFLIFQLTYLCIRSPAPCFLCIYNSIIVNSRQQASCGLITVLKGAGFG